MGFESQECILCGQPSITAADNPQKNNKMKYQIRNMFVLKKLLEISSSTCEDLLLKYGNPSSWISYCEDCFEIIIEAQRILSNLAELENKWKSVKKSVETKIYDHSQCEKTQLLNDNGKRADKINFRIRKETTRRLQLNNNATRPHNIVDTLHTEKEIKMEIEEFNSNDDDWLPSNPIEDESYQENQFVTKESLQLKLGDLRGQICTSISGNEDDITDEGHSAEDNDDNQPNTSQNNSVLTRSRRKGKQTARDWDLPPCTKVESFQCSKCNRSFKNSQGLNYHLRRYHVPDAEKPFHCDDCGRGFCNAASIFRHTVAQHTGENTFNKMYSTKTFPCEVCSKCFTTKQNLKYHFYKAHKSGFRAFMCPTCEETFETTKLLKIHVKLHTGNKASVDNSHSLGVRDPESLQKSSTNDGKDTTERKTGKDLQGSIPCSGCPKLFKTMGLMKHHHKIVHLKEKDFLCEICSKAFSSKLQLKYHRMKEHEKSDKLKCKKCGKICAEPGALLKHIALMHDRTECKFVCPVCNYRTVSKSQLDSHLVTKHTNAKPFSCTLCDKSYARSNYLKTHMRTHSGERPFVCEVCKKDFACERRMKRHMEDLHSTGKNHQCETCGKSFPSRHYLSTHIYDVHKKRKRDPVPDKVLIDDELLQEVVLKNNCKIKKTNKIVLHLEKSMQITNSE